MDVDARLQLFDLKTTYQFQTSPGIDKYNMPLYSVQTETTSPAQTIGMFPVYQGFMGPSFINGIEMPFYTERNAFFDMWPNYNQTLVQSGTGDGSAGPYTLNLPFLPNSPTATNFPSSSGIIRGHVDLTGVISTGVNQDPPLDTGTGTAIPLIPTTSVYPQVYFTATASDGSTTVAADTGIFLDANTIPLSQNYGLLMNPGKAPFGNAALSLGYVNSFNITGATQANPCVLTCTSNFAINQTITIAGVSGMTELNGRTFTVTAVSPTTVTINVNSTGFTAYTANGTATSLTNLINYVTGIASNVVFPKTIPSGNPINAQCVFYQQGIPRAVLFYNNVLTLRAPPNTSYLVELDAYLTPAAFFNTEAAIPFGYMAEYIARGAARKLLSDTGDWEQFAQYEPLFKEQESLVHVRSQRQWTSTRTQTIYSNQGYQGNFNQSSLGV